MRVVNVMANIMNTAIFGGILIACTNAYESAAAEIECLATNIYFEALTESEAGQVAVANVTMNRVKSKHFPNSVCEVVWEPKQFSWTHDGKSDRPSSQKKYKEVYEIAKAVYNGDIIDITEGATFYHADYVNPPWAKVMDRVTQIDRHIFYKHEGR